MQIAKKPREVPKSLKLKAGNVVVDVDENKILGWFTNISGAYSTTRRLEDFVRACAKETGHTILIARGVWYMEGKARERCGGNYFV